MTHINVVIALFSMGSATQMLSNQETGTTLEDRAKPYLAAALAAGNDFVSVSAASGLPNLAPESLASAFGPSLASRTEIGTAPYPTSLGGISMQIVDSAGASRQAQLLYVSPTQINYLVPSGTAAGAATTNIVNGTGNVPSGTVQIQTVAPALFTANGNGQGVVAATAYRTVIPTTLATPLPVFQCNDGPGTCVSVPIAFGVDTPIFATFYATGLRGRSSDSAVTLTIGGQRMTIRSITPADSSTLSAGIDQVLAGLNLSLRGSGEVDVTIGVDGKTSNTGRVNFQ
ncbi:MAG: hypothetical protein M3Z09_00155 [Acidobacteriota bacterium]|nr:hypothetical protein [Acidobacteriota bacterium]